MTIIASLALIAGGALLGYAVAELQRRRERRTTHVQRPSHADPVYTRGEIIEALVDGAGNDSAADAVEYISTLVGAPSWDEMRQGRTE